MFNLNVKTIPMQDQRYDTVGDYYTEGGCTQYRISSMGNRDYEFLIFLHEVIEKQFALKMGVTEQMIDAWDLSHEDVDEPGAMEGCPYREAHMIAEGYERAVASQLGVDWDHYSRTVDEIRKIPNPDRPMQARQNSGHHAHKPRGKVRERSVLKGK